MANFPIKNDTKKQVSLMNESQQSSDEQRNFQLVNAYPEGNQQSPQLVRQMHQSALNEALETYTIRSEGVPENLHFIWQGKLGAIQQNYINAWHQTNPNYQIKIWYDPQALLVHELRKQIEQFAHHGQMLNERGYFEQILQLQNKAYQAILQGIEQQDKTFDQAAAEFMVNQLGSQKQALEHIRKENQASYAKFVQKYSGSIQLADINTLNGNGIEKKYYYQELALRQNLAAASDIVRLEALHQQGGIYIDVDFLPALKVDLFSNALSKDIARLGRLPNGSDTIVINLVKTQLILEQLADNFPGRQLLVKVGYYQDYVAKFRARSPVLRN
ncbi:DNA repair exonuclease SbcCD nuclease subunit [Providencia alcalifaciens]|nr:DNA repair exonuclease SbcCD nuclease subunit [Providencia alcalifaciens]